MTDSTLQDTLTEGLFSQPSEIIDPMHLDLDDFTLVKTIKDNIRESVEFYKSLDLYDRQQKNYEYYLGQQPLYKASNKAKPYKENIIYEGLGRQKPIALSRMPDLTVKPSSDSQESKELAEKISGILNSDTKQRENRKLLGLSFKLEPLYFYSVIKAIWNPEKGKYGDYEFVSVHPENIVFDHSIPNNDQNKMRYIAEKTTITLKEVIMQFPDKEEEIKREFGWQDSEEDDDKKMASPVNIWEVWFHWYELKGKESERIDGVIWIYKNLLLKKMKNPYFDYQGRSKLFSKVMEEKNAYSMDEIFQMFDNQSEDERQEDVVYNNYFQDPQKPYFIMVYENMGKYPVSATSRVEQVLEFQDFINQDGSIIQDMNIRSRGKYVFDTNSVDQTTIDNFNDYDVDQVLGLDVPQGSSINNVYTRIESKAATAQQYRSQGENRQKGFEMLGVNAANRGLADPSATLGQTQMSREGDFTLIDDIVEDTINACAEWQANWAMQFIKLFYNKPHMRHILGKDGDVIHTKLTQDMVDDGMEVIVSASGVDKVMRKRQAIENAKLGFSDPLTFMEDTEQPNPKERAKRAMLAQMAPQMFIQEYLMDQEPQPEQPATNQALGMPPEQAGQAPQGQLPQAPPPAPVMPM